MLSYGRLPCGENPKDFTVRLCLSFLTHTPDPSSLIAINPEIP